MTWLTTGVTVVVCRCQSRQSVNVLPYTPQNKFHEVFRLSSSLESVGWLQQLHCGHRYAHLCTVCSKQLTTVGHFVKHNRIHSGEKAYKCHVCDKALDSLCMSSNLSAAVQAVCFSQVR